MGKLYVLGTPIGNLEDLTFRGLRVLEECDGVIAEDTRVTRKLLEHYKIRKPLFIFHQHSSEREEQNIKGLLQKGKILVLVTDAGTPGISDSGSKLIVDLVKNCPDLEIIPLPGPNAAVAALSISGFPTDRFVFLGFPPHKKGRQTFFKKLSEIEDTAVFYESVHRIIKTLEQINGKESLRTRPLVVARELTKKFETIYRGTAIETLQRLQAENPRGEFTIVMGPVSKQ